VKKNHAWAPLPERERSTAGMGRRPIKRHVMAERYKAEGPDAEFEPGSRGRVLRNRLGIKSVREMERKESDALLSATQQMIG
jgi:hypothetical protein